MKKEIVISKPKGAVNQTPSQMIHFAMEKGADLDKLEKLMTLQERWEANEAKKAYHIAMTNFKSNAPKIDKDKKVSFDTGKGRTTYNHATLYNVTEKISAELSKHGLSASWQTKQNGMIIVTCKITHVKGHSEETSLSAPADNSGSKNSIQAIGSTITYLERYTLLALTGLATFDQDDDGRAVTKAEVISVDEVNQLLDLIVEKSIDMSKFCKAFGITNVEDLPKARYNQAVEALHKKVVK